ncbi:MAG: TlpA disulfide reductase family protein [Ginsengibacter sp.]
MDFKNFNNKIKKNWINILFGGLLFIFLFSTGAKSWLLHQMVSIGLFKVEINKEPANTSFGENAVFSYTDSVGLTASTSSLNGKVVFINFWASWCPPCRAEMSSLNNIYKEFKNDNRFVFLFINEDEKKANAVSYIHKNDFSIPFYSRTSDTSPEIFDGTLPTTVVLDKEGKIILKHEGMGKYDTDEFVRGLKALL